MKTKFRIFSKGISNIVIKKNGKEIAVSVSAVGGGKLLFENIEDFNFGANYGLHQFGVKKFNAVMVSGMLEVESDVKILELK